MKPIRLAITFFAALVLALPSAPALAWSVLGHKLVGNLAQRHLSPAAQSEVRRLLQGEEDPTLGGVASWADFLRTTDPERFKATAPWHYINAVEGGCQFDEKRDCANGGCVTQAIDQQRAILGDRSQPLEARRDALKFLVHFIGDVHQPMHANPRLDMGGNQFEIKLRTPLEPEAYARQHYVDGVMATNLHSVWDYYILASTGLEADTYVDRLNVFSTPAATLRISPPLAWAGESCRLVGSRGLYPSSPQLDQAYLVAMRPLAEQRIQQAAYRLAAVLNSTLSP